MKYAEIFNNLLKAESENEAEAIISTISLSHNWYPIGAIENNFGVIDNQQASPIAALIEKITNSIDAILMRKCLEAGKDPKSAEAPGSMSDAVAQFFGPDYKNWYLQRIRKRQAESIQILAHGAHNNPCITIYDDGEGQHPDCFEKTFLSLLGGNKNEISFVQGKYNMGGTGAIVFCGKKNKYQLIGSRRYDSTGDFGFTIIRKHPRTKDEKKTTKNTWYEYLKIDDRIPRFPITELDIGLSGRKFTTGTIIRLFDYDLPRGSRGALPQEVKRAINQFLFEPALPVYLKDTPKRYPRNKVLEGDCFGLKRQLEDDENKYVEYHFTDKLHYHDIGEIRVTCYVFKAKVDGRSVKETRDIISRGFFYDNMAVLFSLNGQVHGHYTSEFITLALKMPLLKHYLLIHVDCTNLEIDYRQELFMASRDRLKGSDETNDLRKRVADSLQNGRLTEIHKERQNAISVEGGDAKDMLRAFSKNLPFTKDLTRMLKQTFEIEQFDETKKNNQRKHKEKTKSKKDKEPFNPKRYPSFFRLTTGKVDKFITIPEGGERTIQFATDVEDKYFDRSDDSGELQVSILHYNRNKSVGGNATGIVERPDKLLDIRKSSPSDGTIRIDFGATNELRVGNEIEIDVTLEGPEEFETRFWLKVVEPQPKPKKVEKPVQDEEPPIGLPQYELVYKKPPVDSPDASTWDRLGDSGIEMDYGIVMYPYVEGEGQLDKVFINMDSTVLRNYVSRNSAKSIDQKELAEKRYISSIYFHTIFLFSITKNKRYELKLDEQRVELNEYLRDVFSTHYCEFLLNFGTEQLMETLQE